MDIQQQIDKRIEEKHKRIQEYRSETQLSIQLGQAVNLALEYLCNDPDLYKTASQPFELQLDAMTDFFMKFLDKKRKEVFDANERAYAQNPAPTPDEYVAMPKVTQSFYKDKQLENNRATYAQRVADKQKGLQIDIKKLNDERSK